MTIIQNLIRKQPKLKPIERLGCYIPFIEYNKDLLLNIQEKNRDRYIWYYEHLAQSRNVHKNENNFRYKILVHQQLNAEPYFAELTNNIKEKIPLLKDTEFHYQFVKFDKDYTLEVHTDLGRNAVMFFPLTENSSSTDFYRNNKKIKSFNHTSALLLSVDVPHGSQVTQKKITFQIGFNYTNWDALLDYCLCRQLN
jgi:hypothetical protein